MDLLTIPFCVWHKIDSVSQIHFSSNLFPLLELRSFVFMVHLWKDKNKIYNYRGKIKEAIIDNIVVLNIYKCIITKLKFDLHLFVEGKCKRENFSQYRHRLLFPKQYQGNKCVFRFQNLY